jgi:hypothetical protein
MATQRMGLREAIVRLADLPEHTYFYVGQDEPNVSATTPVMLVGYDDDPPKGWRYYLEVPTAREVLDVWSSWRNDRAPSLDEACEAVIYYADNDAYIIGDL